MNYYNRQVTFSTEILPIQKGKGKNMEKLAPKIHICMISDDNYVMPTCVAIQSMINAKKESVYYVIHIVTSSLSASTETQFLKFASDSVEIKIIRDNAQKRFNGYHTFDNNAICVASISALLKFVLADLFNELDKILYLDGDLIVKNSLDELYSYDLENNYVAAVIDSGSIYYKHEYVKKVKSYFNSGVMLLNLKQIRDDNIIPVLLDTKKNLQDASLMDQNVFNLVFDRRVKLLPIKYNFMPVSLERSNSKWTISQINDVYGTKYANKKNLYDDAQIIHYSSKDKPWIDLDGACASEWIATYLKTPISHNLISHNATSSHEFSYGISVIIPCYNVGNYVRQTLSSVLDQTFKDLEIICLDDGSSDDTLQILQSFSASYDNIKVYSNSNHGQGFERNIGIQHARGKYIYFMDSDDLLHKDCFDILYNCAEQNQLDVLYFEGTSFYESIELEEQFPQYKYVYNRKEAYPKVYSGEDLYIKFRKAGDLIVSPCLQFIRRGYLIENNIRFPELPLMEDNLFTFWVILKAQRVKCLSNILFYRRVRKNSTMTARREFDRIKALTVTMQETLRELIKYEKDSPMFYALYTHIREYFKNILSVYDALDITEKNNICSLIPYEQWEILLLSLYAEMEEKRYNETCVKLRKAWQEKTELNKKLQKTYQEKSEINKKLKITYDEKAERGLEIKRLKQELEKERNSCSIIRPIKNIIKRLIKKIIKAF